ncbi:MAG: hypothetical protein Q8O63_12595 [Hoeflea sp.]|nr:hypothetical protein [Hoeflea sp.]
MAPDRDLEDIHCGMAQFMTAKVSGLLLVFIVPWLPENLYGK